MIVTVKDTGIGMSFESKKKIFNKFFTENTQLLNSEGIGLGLTIS